MNIRMAEQRKSWRIGRRQENLVNNFHWRRIPGTLVLAITNLIAGLLLFYPGNFENSLVNSVAASLAPASIWGGVFTVSGILLISATILRDWRMLNIGSATSLFAWTFVCVSSLVAWYLNDIKLSPIAFALFFWMFAGQAAMLFVPLLAKGRGYE